MPYLNHTHSLHNSCLKQFKTEHTHAMGQGILPGWKLHGTRAVTPCSPDSDAGSTWNSFLLFRKPG